MPELGLTARATIVDGGSAKPVWKPVNRGTCGTPTPPPPICRPRKGKGSPVDGTAQAVLAFLAAVLEATFELVKDRSRGAGRVASPKGRLTAGPTVGGRVSCRLSRQGLCRHREHALGLGPTAVTRDGAAGPAVGDVGIAAIAFGSTTRVIRRRGSDGERSMGMMEPKVGRRRQGIARVENSRNTPDQLKQRQLHC